MLCNIVCFLDKTDTELSKYYLKIIDANVLYTFSFFVISCKYWMLAK